MGISTEAVTWGYRFFLGRDPESAEAVQSHLGARDELQLAKALMRSPEFAARRRQFGLEPVSDLRELAKLDIDTDATPEDLAACLAKIKVSWSHLGAVIPHFSVLTDDRFLPDNLSAAIEDFWASGRIEAERVVRILERHGLSLSGKTCVEYGCGVGRVTTALSRSFARIDAYDISPNHLALARQRAQELGVGNVRFHECSSDPLADLERCDAFYSKFVFQHNPPPVMTELIRRALGALRPGGIGIFQIPSYISGYYFSLQEWLGADRLPDIQMHCLPQQKVFALIAGLQCELLEVREDDATGNRSRMVSNTFVARKT
jgi:SAM-dependent methyltransferase